MSFRSSGLNGPDAIVHAFEVPKIKIGAIRRGQDGKRLLDAYRDLLGAGLSAREGRVALSGRTAAEETVARTDR